MVPVLPAYFHFAGRWWPSAKVAEIGHIGLIAGRPHPTGMTRQHIVTTAPGGRVLITTPSLTAMCFMTCGGGRWDDVIPYELPGFLELQIAEQATHGVGEHAARRFVEAMQEGGRSADEAYGIMLERFAAPLGTGHELWATEDLPTDRTYRDAWRRSANGGPILIDQRKVMEIDETRIARMWAAYEPAKSSS